MIATESQIRTYCKLANRAMLGYAAEPETIEELSEWLEAIVSAVLDTCQDEGLIIGDEGQFAEDVIGRIAEDVVGTFGIEF